MPEAGLQKNILELLETEGSLSVSQLVERVEAGESAVNEAISELVDRNLVMLTSTEDGKQVKCESPVPISEVAFRGELTPTQAIILFLYQERGYGQSKIARMLDYSPGNIQTNITRIEEKLGRELE